MIKTIHIQTTWQYLINHCFLNFIALRFHENVDLYANLKICIYGKTTCITSFLCLLGLENHQDFFGCATGSLVISLTLTRCFSEKIGKMVLNIKCIFLLDFMLSFHLLGFFCKYSLEVTQVTSQKVQSILHSRMSS